MKIRKIMIFATAAILVAAAVLFGLHLKKEKTAPSGADAAERVVKLVRVEKNAAGGGISYPGRVKPVRRAELFFRVSGPVIERNLKYGQTVEKGDVLMRIDPRDYEREVERLTQELKMQKVQNSLATIEFNRQKQLIQSKAISQSTFDAVDAKKKASDAQVQMLEVSLKIAKDKLQDTVLYAPFHGAISDLKIEQYEIANANVPVVTLNDLREAEIKISIPGGNLPDASIYDEKRFLGLKFDVTFPGRGDKVFKAAIYEFKPVASEESETYEVTLRMKVPDDFLILPGMSVEVHGLPYYQKEKKEQIKLPFAAVFKRDGQEAVWVYHPKTGKLEMRKVKTGRMADGSSVFIENDLKPGEYVVAAGGDWLTEKTAVRVLNPEVFHENH